MSQVAWKPDDNDDDPEDIKKGKKKPDNSFVSVRRYARIPLKIIAALATVYVCVLSSERYFYYWVQTTIERTDMHVSEINFPAVTIIPMNFTSLNRSEQSMRYERAFNLVQSVIWQTPVAARLREENFTEFSDIDDLSVTSWGIYASWQLHCQSFFTECQWRRKPVNCCDIFRPGTTFNGFAFVFNSEILLDRDPTWPWSVAASGSQSGLNVKIRRKQKLYTVNTLGVIIHEPEQYLGMGIDYSSEDRIVVPVEPLSFSAEEDVRARPISMRRCYFETEITSEVSRSTCIYNCHLNYILNKCNCTINFPVHAKSGQENITETSDPTLRLCGVPDLSCFNKHKLTLFSMSNIIEESRDNQFTTVDCGCFPQCDHTQYHTSTYTEKMSTLTSHASEIEIDVYFQEETLFSYRSMLRFTLIDLMVSYGGIAGLIMGISVLGGVNAFLDRFACCRLPNGS
ncbi:pickpocket protein 19 [Drosophila kikkawai]|uniref:Pickpocket protein 19 n=1 Tax=Drosophila kikkawai TaxID=30033 RepID=A0A6P4I168_DROKI